jgi:hypothetical protein
LERQAIGSTSRCCPRILALQKAIEKAATLDPPFTVKQVMGHLKWMYTAGELEVDGESYVVPATAKQPKPAANVEH